MTVISRDSIIINLRHLPVVDKVLVGEDRVLVDSLPVVALGKPLPVDHTGHRGLGLSADMGDRHHTVGWDLKDRFKCRQL